MSNEGTTAVRTRGVIKTFWRGDNAVQALKGVDFDAHCGEMIMIVGPSGCGKTTFLSVVCGTMRADEGSIEVFDTDLLKLSSGKLTAFRGANVGFVFQQFNLIPTWSILENASVPPEVEAAIDKRSSMSAIGNLNDYVKFQMAEGMAKGGPGIAGSAAEIAMGFGMANQMMGQGAFNMNAPQTAPAAAAAPATDILTPAQVAQTLGVTEGDVIASIDAGDLKGKKIGSQYRITKAALDEFLAH
jgi:excisionase family DNA binding protein